MEDGGKGWMAFVMQVQLHCALVRNWFAVGPDAGDIGGNTRTSSLVKWWSHFEETGFIHMCPDHDS